MKVKPVNQPNMSYQASGVLYTDCIFLFALKLNAILPYGGQVLKLFANVPEGVCSDFAFGVVCFKSSGQLAVVFMFGSFVVLGFV